MIHQTPPELVVAAEHSMRTEQAQVRSHDVVGECVRPQAQRVVVRPGELAQLVLYCLHPLTEYRGAMRRRLVREGGAHLGAGTHGPGRKCPSVASAGDATAMATGQALTCAAGTYIGWCCAPPAPTSEPNGVKPTVR
ncbi:MAG: hypothetical protein ACK6DP_05350 [Gemmatimonas sp.]|uniref:hypothetical protein n=1 Tax=Gemmatimonas sp. TaxID=1962908 RepID=UPI00391EEDD5